MTNPEMHDIMDKVISTLYNHMDRNGMHFERELLAPKKIKLAPKDADRLWDVLLSTGLVTSIIGFGNEGKLAITPAGIQMITRFGAYKNYLDSQKGAAQGGAPQISIQLAPGPEEKPATQEKALPAKKQAAARSRRPGKTSA